MVPDTLFTGTPALEGYRDRAYDRACRLSGADIHSLQLRAATAASNATSRPVAPMLHNKSHNNSPFLPPAPSTLVLCVLTTSDAAKSASTIFSGTQQLVPEIRCSAIAPTPPRLLRSLGMSPLTNCAHASDTKASSFHGGKSTGSPALAVIHRTAASHELLIPELPRSSGHSLFHMESSEATTETGAISGSHHAS